MRFLGFVPEEQKPDLLASAEVAVFPAMGGESFGIVLIEAMAAGAGVVLGGDNPGYRSVLEDSPPALFYPRDTSDFADRLQAFLTDRKLRSSLHAHQQVAVRQYDVSVVGARVEKFYTQAILQRTRKVR